tara:strand:+ start:3701 stop:3958 length:258 start_codon:yes stop_codon:yes gene_type:complete
MTPEETKTLRKAALYATKEIFSFQEWLKLLDTYLQGWVGVTHSDLTDRLWRDVYEDELSPVEAIEHFFDTTTDVEKFWRTELYGM